MTKVHPYRDQEVRDQLLEWVRLTRKKFGEKSAEHHKIRREADYLIERMRIDGPDHGVELDWCNGDNVNPGFMFVRHRDSEFHLAFTDDHFKSDPKAEPDPFLKKRRRV